MGHPQAKDQTTLNQTALVKNRFPRNFAVLR
jgi:hypothetical protein